MDEKAPLYPAPLAETVAALRSGSLDLTENVREICHRVEHVEPLVSALLPEPNRCRRLLDEAQALQQQYPDPAGRPPLYGVVLGVKDIFHVNGFPTRAGSQLPSELFAGPEATCVTRLREAGVLILGKTVTTEFAYFEPGPTRNPHHLAHTPGGSSSGSAAAVAAGMCHLALGTQTIGSVIRPAAFCGIVGLKPSYDRIPTAGLVYFSKSADHVGLFTQDVAGMKLAASVVFDDWQPLVTEPLERPVLGVPEGPYLAQAAPEGLAAFEQHLARLAAAGYEIRRVPALQDIAAINQRHRRMIAAEIAHEHAEWFSQYVSLYRPRTVEIIREGQSVSSAELTQARAGQTALRLKLMELMDATGVEIWVSPPAPGPAPVGIHATGDPIMNLPWTHAGMPAITVPAGQDENGLPLGLQCVARFMEDEKLLQWAESIAVALAAP